MINRSFLKVLAAGMFLLLFSAASALADEYGSIRGTVSDTSGAVIPGVQLTATNVATGIAGTTTSKGDGSYDFLQLHSPAIYKVSAQQSGFKGFQANDIQLALNQVFVLNITLEVGSVTQQVTVEAAPAQVETTSMQLGANISGATIVNLPLNGRNWINLQQTLPGTVASSDRFGTNFSTNGARTQANGYMINGVDANDLPLNTPLEIPSPDAIGEVHIISNTINPEYGRNSGAILNAVTKSGTNSFHGDAFEFYRDTSMNTRNFFLPKPDVFHQNQFGGTIGGPIKKEKAFFFFSYQGTRARQAQSGGTTTVFTPAQRGGVFPDVAGFTDSKGVFHPNMTTSPFPMVGEDGASHPAGTAYNTLFPTGHIPTGDFNPIAANLTNTFVPLPNFGPTEFSFNPITTSKADQEISRIDYNISSKDTLWGYWFTQNSPSTDSLPFIGSTLPGFAETAQRKINHYTADWTHTFGGSAVNEFRLGYNRFNFVAVQPLKAVLPSSVGFTGINVQDPAGAGLPVMALTGFFDLGFSDDGPQPRKDQTFQVTDNYSKIVGKHTLKFGVEMRRAQVENPFFFENDGHFDFQGGGAFSTGDPGADFLLGIADDYVQSSGGFIDARTQEYYSYGQDQFKIRQNLTLTYGLAWQVDTPLTDIFNHSVAINAFRPGQQSTVFPTAPQGLVFPGDSGITASGYHTHFGHFGPRAGFAWSPGRSTKWAIRGGVGLYYNVPEEELTLQNLIAPPFALIDFGIGDVGGSPAFATPFTDITGSNAIPNKYPFAPAKPGSKVDFSFFEPFSLNVLDPNFNIPSSYNYNLTVERQLPGAIIMSVAYVGLQGRHLENTKELNPAGSSPGINPLCAATPGCSSNNVGSTAPASFRYDPSIFGSVGQQSTDANSNYNSLQVSADKHFTHGLHFRAVYSWSHSLDVGSSFENSQGITNPFNLHSTYGDSSFDARNRFVFSYFYNLPSVRKFHAFERIPSRLTDGWEITGVTALQSGFPITLTDSSRRSFICNFVFSFYGCPDRPNVLGAVTLVDPRSSAFVNAVKGGKTSKDHYFFNPNDFTRETKGVYGNAGRNFFHGPGINNVDFALFKNTKITESTAVQLRFEFYNLFNHTQFNNPSGNVNSVNFGRTLSARSPRLIQLAAKFNF